MFDIDTYSISYIRRACPRHNIYILHNNKVISLLRIYKVTFCESNIDIYTYTGIPHNDVIA